jgi:putative MATE family efflux protein
MKKTAVKLISSFKDYMSCEVVPFHAVMGIILPVFVDIALSAVIGVVNSAMVSSSGPGVVSATSLTGTLVSIFQCLFLSVATGGAVVISQYKGKGDLKKLKENMSELFFLVFLLGVAISVVLFIFAREFFNLLYGNLDDKTVFENGIIYLKGMAASTFLVALSQGVLATLRGLGDGKACMAISVASSLVSIISNTITIYVLDMGLYGVIISMTLNRICALTLGVILLKKFHPELEIKFKTFFAHQKENGLRIIKVASPFAIENLFFSAGNVINSTILSNCGAIAVEVNAIVGSLMIFQHAAVGVESGSVSIIGQCVGAGEYKQARRMVNHCVIFAMCSSGIIAWAFCPFIPLIMRAFNPSAEAATLIPIVYMIYAAVYPLVAPSSTVGAAGLRASGDGTFTTIGAMIAMYGVKIVLGYTLAVRLGFGIFGICIAAGGEWFTRGVMFTLRRFSKKWCSHKLI